MSDDKEFAEACHLVRFGVIIYELFWKDEKLRRKIMKEIKAEEKP